MHLQQPRKHCFEARYKRIGIKFVRLCNIEQGLLIVTLHKGVKVVMA